MYFIDGLFHFVAITTCSKDEINKRENKEKINSQSS